MSGKCTRCDGSGLIGCPGIYKKDLGRALCPICNDSISNAGYVGMKCGSWGKKKT